MMNETFIEHKRWFRCSEREFDIRIERQLEMRSEFIFCGMNIEHILIKKKKSDLLLKVMLFYECNDIKVLSSITLAVGSGIYV